MDSHPKAMTVSYGTFSCTLDGFDDPFTTMQLVAEYFRKLSASDRYFGGEPLQPDSSALHQIAKSANTNRIDAEVSDNSVILRQADVIDVPSKVNIIEDNEPEDTAKQDVQPREIATENDTVAEKADTVDDKEPEAAFISRRKPLPMDDLVDEATDKDGVAPVADVKEEITKAPDETAPDTVTKAVSDALIASLDDHINDTTTADELAPSLEEEIPSETVSAALKALKSGEAIDRWLETANQKMAAPEQVSKANALERLKAAVAATEADRAVRMEAFTSETVETGEERRDNTISFRRELAKVRKAYEQETSVFSRPKVRRTASASSTTGARPLVLDMDQRISRANRGAGATETAEFKKKSGLTLVSGNKSSRSETNGVPTAKAIRRVPKNENANPDVKSTELPSFDEFAKIMGASTLIELLEASAAYMSLVLGKDQYSEKQISANLPEHIKNIVKDEECIGTLDKLNKRGFIEADSDGSYTISMKRKAAYQKKYLAG